MPPINQQGSRSGLVTSVVIFAVLFVTAAIFAIYFNVQLKATEADFTNYKKQYNGVVSDSTFTTPAFAALQTAKGDPTTSMGATDVFDLAVKQRDALAASIAGTRGDTAAATKAASDAMAAAAKLKSSGVNVPNNLAGTVTTLVTAVNTDDAKIADLNQQLAAAKTELTNNNKAIADASAARDKAMEDARAAAAADLQKVNDQFTANKGVIDQLTKDQADAAKKAQDAAQAAQVATAEQQKEMQKLRTDNAGLQAKLGNRRPDVGNAVVRVADGRIVRLPNNEICYINLGQGDQVTPGMTFEVYDRGTGVPPLPANETGDEQLPVGKASIEITRVGATSSECRIVKIQPGAILSEGDLIENLVYDPNVKYQFVVYGQFDLAQSGRPNSADTEVIKRLISQWGGKIVPNVNVDTDFVVLGKEPVLPDFTKEELDQPLNADKLAKAQAELDKYQEVVQNAKDLHIPILNQNRFLYYVGYYDQANR